MVFVTGCLRRNAIGPDFVFVEGVVVEAWWWRCGGGGVVVEMWWWRCGGRDVVVEMWWWRCGGRDVVVEV